MIKDAKAKTSISVSFATRKRLKREAGNRDLTYDEIVNLALDALDKNLEVEKNE